MYKRIFVTLDASPCDRTIIDHIKELAKLCGSNVTLLHVADGWAARRFGKEAVSAEITEDTEYLQKVQGELQNAGIPTAAHLLFGEPRAEILKWLDANPCDLLAMGTHGHKFLGDLVLGTTASHIQHRVDMPVLLLRKRIET
ncbi:MAG TPA: universal stress protein [Phycisphaerae bacterium]|jgi:nucleotide-binding universal stress UspA family protein